MITINQQPDKYSTLNSANFQMTSDRVNLVSFRVTVLDYLTQAAISIKKFPVFPNLPNGTAFDLSPLLSSFLETRLPYSQILGVPVAAPSGSRAYQIIATEIYLDGNGNLTDGDTIAPADIFYALNFYLSKTSLINGASGFVARPGFGINFLTKNLETKKTNNALDFISFYSEINLTLVIDVFNSGGTLLGKISNACNPGSSRYFVANISPALIYPLYASVSFCNVYLQDLTGAVYSNVKRIGIKSANCNSDLFSFVFLNSLSGYDTFEFGYPKTSTTSTKTTIDQPEYLIDKNNFLTNKSADYNIFNQTSKVLNSESERTFTFLSEALTEKESILLKQLVESEQVYFKFKNANYLYPVQLNKQNFEQLNRKYSTANSRITISFTTTEPDFNIYA